MRQTVRRAGPLHGTSAVTDGKLQGGTDTDYFYFFCPHCGDREIMRVLNYSVNLDEPANYAKDLAPRPSKDFIIALELYCQKCGLHDLAKVSNIGWQGGRLPTQEQALDWSAPAI